MMRLRQRAKRSNADDYLFVELNLFCYRLAFPYLIFLCFLNMSRNAAENRVELFLAIEQQLMSPQEIITAAMKGLDIIFG
jgi:hypothetical protein